MVVLGQHVDIQFAEAAAEAQLPFRRQLLILEDQQLMLQEQFVHGDKGRVVQRFEIHAAHFRADERTES